MTKGCQMKKNNDPFPYKISGPYGIFRMPDETKARAVMVREDVLEYKPRAKYDYIAPNPATTLASIKDVLVEFREGTSSMGEVVLNVEKLLEEAGL